MRINYISNYKREIHLITGMYSDVHCTVEVTKYM